MDEISPLFWRAGSACGTGLRGLGKCGFRCVARFTLPVARRVAAAVVGIANGLLRALGLLFRVVLRRTKRDFAVQRYRLHDDVEAFAVLVGKRGADWRPPIVLAVAALGDGIGSKDRLLLRSRGLLLSLVAGQYSSARMMVVTRTVFAALGSSELPSRSGA
jgi:hypothetical protein